MGEPGSGAAEQSRRAAERVERLRRELQQAERSQLAWAAGARGEAQVAEKLARLEQDGWRVLHDLHWPGRPKANLDHLLIGPGGIVIIDAKNWSGDVRVKDGRLHQNGYARDAAPAGVLRQVQSVAVLLEPFHRPLVKGWLCMVAQPDIDEPTASGVPVVGLRRLLPNARGLPPVLTPAEVSSIYEHLGALLTGPQSPAILTTLSPAMPEVRTVLAASDDASAWYLQRYSGGSATAGAPAPVSPQQIHRRTPSTRPRARTSGRRRGTKAAWLLLLPALVLLVFVLMVVT